MNDYPAAAVETAKKVLQFKEDNPKMDCGTLVGWNRANQIAKRENLSFETVQRTYSFLSRAKTYNTGSYTNKDGEYVCGSIMYDAWGGNSMLEWSKKKVEEKKSMKRIEITGTIGEGTGSKDYFDYCYSEIKKDEDFEIVINSLGGDFFTAVDIYSKIRKHEGKTKAIYEGLCASAATLIASACDEVEMNSTSAILIHNLSQTVDIFAQLKKEDIESLLQDLEKNIKNLDTLNDLAVIMYQNKCKDKSKEEIKSLMAEDKWILAKDALEFGLVDKIIEDKQGVTAQVRIAASKQFKNNKMDLKQRLLEIFAASDNVVAEDKKEEETQMEQEEKKDYKSEIDEEVKQELAILSERIDKIEAMLIAMQEEKTEEEEETEEETEMAKKTEELESRISSVESRDSQIAEVLQQFVQGVQEQLKETIDKQNRKLEETVTQLQLKENSIVTSDKTFEQKTVTTADWINELKNFKTY